MGQRAPLATCPQNVQNRIDDFAAEMIGWASAIFDRRH
jgi:hypothetical protein